MRENDSYRQFLWVKSPAVDDIFRKRKDFVKTVKCNRGLFGKKNIKRKLKGSATIEAAYIIPVIIFSLIAVICLTFYLYDFMKAEADADWLIWEMEEEYETLENVERPAGKDVSDRLGGYLQVNTVEAGITMFEDRYMAEVFIRMKNPGIPLWGDRLFPNIHIVRTKEITDRSNRIRLFDTIIDTVEGLKQRINGR